MVVVAVNVAGAYLAAAVLGVRPSALAGAVVLMGEEVWTGTPAMISICFPPGTRKVKCLFGSALCNFEKRKRRTVCSQAQPVR